MANKVSLVYKKRTKILRPNNAYMFIPQSQILLPTINSIKKGFILLAILEVLISLNSPHCWLPRRLWENLPVTGEWKAKGLIPHNTKIALPLSKLWKEWCPYGHLFCFESNCNFEEAMVIIGLPWEWYMVTIIVQHIKNNILLSYPRQDPLRKRTTLRRLWSIQ